MQEIARIETVTVIGPANLRVAWRDGGTATIDLSGWIGRGDPLLHPLEDIRVFARAAVAGHGSLVSWDGGAGELAIDSYHLKLIAEEQSPFGAAEAAAWQALIGLSNAEAAELIGVVPSTWSAYKAGASIPATVARLCRAAQRDTVILHAHHRPRAAGRPRSNGLPGA